MLLWGLCSDAARCWPLPMLNATNMRHPCILGPKGAGVWSYSQCHPGVSAQLSVQGEQREGLQRRCPTPGLVPRTSRGQ